MLVKHVSWWWVWKDFRLSRFLLSRVRMPQNQVWFCPNLPQRGMPSEPWCWPEVGLVYLARCVLGTRPTKITPVAEFVMPGALPLKRRPTMPEERLWPPILPPVDEDLAKFQDVDGGESNRSSNRTRLRPFIHDRSQDTITSAVAQKDPDFRDDPLEAEVCWHLLALLWADWPHLPTHGLIDPMVKSAEYREHYFWLDPERFHYMKIPSYFDKERIHHQLRSIIIEALLVDWERRGPDQRAKVLTRTPRTGWIPQWVQRLRGTQPSMMCLRELGMPARGMNRMCT